MSPSSIHGAMTRCPPRSAVFVSHASEDKEAVALPLAELCADRGLSVWIDQTAMSLGGAPRSEIDRALASCSLGVVIVSPDFITKSWPQRELDALIELDKPILVIRHRLTRDQLRVWSPIVAARVSVSTEDGMNVLADAIETEVMARTAVLGSPEAALVDRNSPIVALRGEASPIALKPMPASAASALRLWVGETVVTQEQFEAVAGTNESHFRGATLPVESVSWHDAIRFANRLSELEGRPPAYSTSGADVRWDSKIPGFRLLTSAEWEWSCRAVGVSWWCGGEFDRLAWTLRNARASTMAAGSLHPNPWGLYDMLGLVWEWVWGPAAADVSEVRHLRGDQPIREIRGGGFRTPAAILAPSLRREILAEDKRSEVGFRIALCE